MTHEFDSMTGAELVSLYNVQSAILGLKPINRFRTKADGIRRLEKLFSARVETVVVPELAVTEKNFTDYNDPEMTQIDDFGAFTAELDEFVARDSDLTVAMTVTSNHPMAGVQCGALTCDSQGIWRNTVKTRRLASYGGHGSITALLQSYVMRSREFYAEFTRFISCLGVVL